MVFALCACETDKEPTPTTPATEITTHQDSTSATVPDETQTPDDTTTTPPED